MIKALYNYTPIKQLSFGTTWHYYSPTTQTKLDWIDSDTTVPAVHIFDETITYRFSSLSEAKFGIKNILDVDVYQPSYYYQLEGGIKREGRNYFVSYIQKF